MSKISKEEFVRKVGSYFPPEAIDYVLLYFNASDFHFKVTKPRLTKKGDFKYFKNKSCKPTITVNNDLCSYDFLLVFLHELAHYKIYRSCPGKELKPHGEEWKEAYKELLQELLDTVALPKDIANAFKRYIPRIQSSTALDVELEKVFDRCRVKLDGSIYLRDLEEGEVFIWRNECFRLDRFVRTRGRCTRLKNQNMYLMPGVLKVKKCTKNNRVSS